MPEPQTPEDAVPAADKLNAVRAELDGKPTEPSTDETTEASSNDMPSTPSANTEPNNNNEGDPEALPPVPDAKAQTTRFHYGSYLNMGKTKAETGSGDSTEPASDADSKDHAQKEQSDKPEDEASKEELDQASEDALAIFTASITRLFPTEEMESEVWDKITEKNPRYKSKIDELRSRAQAVSNTKDSYDSDMIQLAVSPIARGINNRQSAKLLAGILLSRISNRQGGHIEKRGAVEAEEMRKELNFDETKADLSPEDIMSSVLKGELTVSHYKPEDPQSPILDMLDQIQRQNIQDPEYLQSLSASLAEQKKQREQSEVPEGSESQDTPPPPTTEASPSAGTEPSK